MKYTDRHINRHYGNSLLIGLLALLWVCLSACSSGDDEANNGNQTKVPTKLYIYLYTPQTESSTRAYDGDVNPIAYENSIYKLQIWVFTHDSHKLIGYYAPEESPGLSAANPYELIQLTIDETYAETPAASRERVDVYVLANVQQENCNLTLDGNTTQAQLEAALMEKTTIDPFGVTNPVMSVPTNLGLPMSGVLRNQPVTGEAYPTLGQRRRNRYRTADTHHIEDSLCLLQTDRQRNASHQQHQTERQYDSNGRIPLYVSGRAIRPPHLPYQDRERLRYHIARTAERGIGGRCRQRQPCAICVDGRAGTDLL